MKKLSSPFLPNFSHVYVEQSAREYPLAQELLARFSRSEVIPIENYKEVFNRFKQSWRLQKESPKLILAAKRGTILYKTGEFVPDFGIENYYYASPALNCIYDCHYCFLQGMYPSANLVVFVNSSDFFAAAGTELEKNSPLHVCISYDSDLLALEGILPFCREWIDFTRQNPGLHIEIRTKSVNYSALAGYPACERVTLAWTVSPEAYADKFETGAPPPKARLAAAARALRDGWPVRICLDPVMTFDNWEDEYGELAQAICALQEFGALKDVCVGTFRMNSEQFARIERQRPSSDLINLPFAEEQGKISCEPDTRRRVKDFFTSRLNLAADRLVFHG